ncbi:Helix-destabilizing protein [uncultured Clostridium sp.]|nr:Helix-destabilizing protein [uncultured Clostridium sp.]
MNQVVIVGRLVRDSELKYLQGNGTAALSFSVAVDRDYKKKDGTKETDFINMQMMGTRAEKLAEYLTKGKLIATSGSLRVNNYKDQEGNNRSFTFVNVNNLEFIPTGKKEDNQPTFTPSFEPYGLDPKGFEAINDDELPF